MSLAPSHADVRQSIETVHELDADLPPRVTVLTMPGTSGSQHTIYLLGTAHISEDSANDVRKLIKAVKPQVVMLELCRARRSALSAEQNERLTMVEMAHLITRKHVPAWQVLYSWFLSRYAEELGVLVGVEFRAAAEAAASVHAAVCLGDRPINITIARVWAALSFVEKVKFMFTLAHSGLFMPGADELREMTEELKEADALTKAMLELSKEFPALHRPLIGERDQYMVSVLRTLAADAPKVVAVVGAGHLAGIRDNWEADIDIEELQRLPPRRRSWVPIILLATGTVTVTSFILVRWRRSGR